MPLKTFYNSIGDCSSVREKFSEYLDGVLTEDERHTIHEHLRLCRVCSDCLDELCKVMSLIVDFREECLPGSIMNFRLPRSTFVEIFPTIEEEKPVRSWGSFVPFVYALIFLFLIVSSWEFAYRHTFENFYNASSWVEVVAKI